MRKTFMGVQLRRLREERGMTQVALARALGLSASYLNQIEQNQRPLTVPVLLKISAALGVDVQRFSDDEEARLIAGLNEVLADQPPGGAGQEHSNCSTVCAVVVGFLLLGAFLIFRCCRGYLFLCCLVGSNGYTARNI